MDRDHSERLATLSVVIPAWSGTQELADMLLALCEAVRPMCDQLVVSEDSGNSSEFIARLADTYLVHHQRLGHINNSKLGIEATTGEYIALLDTDILITQGSLRDLCVPGHVVCGQWKDQREYKGFWAWCFVADRKVLDEYPIPEDPGHEGLDSWGVNLGRNGPYLWSDKMEYSHLRARSYSALRKARDEAARIERETNLRELSLDRHLQRMRDDQEYRKWVEASLS